MENTVRAFLILLALLINLPSSSALPRLYRARNARTNAAAMESTFVVTKTGDTNDGACDSDCSLREAIIAANQLPGSDTITLPAGTYFLTLAGENEDNSATGDLDIKDSLAINGSGASSTVIDAKGLDRVFHITDALTVTISGVTIRNGKVDGAGGGIWINSGSPQGVTTLNNVWITQNTSFNGGGVAIPNGGKLVINNSTISSNVTNGSGGGIQLYDGTMTLVNSTVSNNSAASPGGGIYNYFGPNGGIVNLYNSTIVGNTSTSGGGIASFAGTVNMRNTIIAGNRDSDCLGTITSQGYNLIQNKSCTINGITTGNLTGVDPLLGALQNNGGTTYTYALQAGSPAINAGSPATPGSGGTSCEAADQRGLARPQSGRCDIGAYEKAPNATIGGIVVNLITQTTTPGVTVTLYFGSFGGSPNYTTTTDANGSFAFMNIPAGQYQLASFPPAGMIGSGKIITVGSSDDSSYLLTLIKDIPLVSPANHADVEASSPMLCWEPQPQAVSYTLQVNDPHSTLIANPTVVGACYQLRAALQDGVTYAWSIANALNSQGQNIGGSQTFFFTYHAASITVPIVPSGETQVTSWDESTVIGFPAGSLPQSGTVTYQPEPQPPAADSLAGIQKAYDITASVPLAEGATYQVSITYTDAEIRTVNQATLALYYWDTATSQWVREPTSSLDPISHTLTATPSHFSTWAVLGESHWIYLPAIRR